MPSYDNCTSCFYPLGGQSVCPNCGRDQNKEKKFPGTIPPFTQIHGRYLLGRVLGKGGFGITYVAYDMKLSRVVAIKEYMPSDYSTRSSGTLSITPFSDENSKRIFQHGKEKFVEEARTLLTLKENPIVVDILDYFNENNTAYLVMEYLDGSDLKHMARDNGGTLDPAFAKEVFVTIASSLMAVHEKGILHRDLSPDNIIYTKDGRVKLIDFGAARSYLRSQNRGMSILLKVGYAPPEQYKRNGNHGPWCDVYALCATYYNLVSGAPLIDALFRYRGEQQTPLAKLNCGVSKQTSDVIEKGMALDYRERYPSFKELLDDIDIDVAAPQPRPVPPAPQTPPRQPVQPPVQQPPIQQPPVQQPVLRPGPTGERPGGGTRAAGRSHTGGQNRWPYVATVLGKTLTNKMPLGQNGSLMIGRKEEPGRYVITGDKNISREHCWVRYDGSRLYLMDRSANGTYLANGQRLPPGREIPIEPGTYFYIASPNHMLYIST